LAARRAKSLTPLWTTADWTYLRFHAGLARPQPCYGRRSLETWAQRLAEGWPAGDAWVFFNNDARCCAVRDAVVFAGLVADTGMTPPEVPSADEVRPERRRGARAGQAKRPAASTGAERWHWAEVHDPGAPRTLAREH